jgi:nickel-dependent lactate racemase
MVEVLDRINKPKEVLMAKTKNVTIEYHNTWIDISVHENAEIFRYGTPEFPEIPLHANPGQAVRDALDNPTGIERIPELVKRKSKVTIAFDDHLKSPAEALKIIIPVVVDELLKAGVREEDISLLCATGTHCKRRPNELKALLGEQIYKRFRPFNWREGKIYNHDCTEGNTYLGETEIGCEVDHDSALLKSDLLIYVGTIFPVSYGGYPGQGIVIGLASQRALKSLHSYDVFRVGGALSGDFRPEKNIYRKHKLAVNEKIEKEIGKKVFYIDAITGPGAKIVNVFAGHAPELEKKTYIEADKYFLTKMSQKDIVVIGLPHDLGYDTSDNPIISCSAARRAISGWRNKPLLRKSGVIIALAQCTGAISPRRPSDSEAQRLYREQFEGKDLWDYFDSFVNNPEYIYKYRYEYAYSPIHGIMMGQSPDTLKMVARQTIFAGDVNPGVIREAGAVPARNFDEALDMAAEIIGKDVKDTDILVFPSYFHEPKPVFEVE